jgi:hypothetical protein
VDGEEDEEEEEEEEDGQSICSLLFSNYLTHP